MSEYDPADDARKSYYAAVEAKRQRGDTHWPAKTADLFKADQGEAA